MAEPINPSGGRIISIGECMVELARGGDDRFGLAYGGDTFNTAVYLARSGVEVAYATALGDDGYSDGIIALARGEGVATDLFAVVSGRMPGLYLIETDGHGERTFYYWRDRAPARELLDGPAGDDIENALCAAGVIYFSGVTLSLYSAAALDRFAHALETARGKGAAIVMDSNYRPRGWQQDAARARRVMDAFWPLATLALPTFDDEAALWGDRDPAATANRLKSRGVGEIAIKLGAQGALIAGAGYEASVPATEDAAVVDTTGAGDSFNAGYLSARIQGQPPVSAAIAGHQLAGVVVQHRGAIVPRAATDAVTRGLSAARPPAAPGR
jgi:2-dehydro-3-deoxygluconokinase